jgi:hypothetical protein
VRGNFNQGFSNQALKKSLLIGADSKIVDFGIDGGMKLIRTTVPTNIRNCVFTKGTRWICSSGFPEIYFLFELVYERTFLTFNKSLYGYLENVDNNVCTVVNDGSKLICL